MSRGEACGFSLGIQNAMGAWLLLVLLEETLQDAKVSRGKTLVTKDLPVRLRVVTRGRPLRLETKGSNRRRVALESH